jgi:hypothetical protein
MEFLALLLRFAFVAVIGVTCISFFLYVPFSYVFLSRLRATAKSGQRQTTPRISGIPPWTGSLFGIVNYLLYREYADVDDDAVVRLGDLCRRFLLLGFSGFAAIFLMVAAAVLYLYAS